MLGIYDIIAKHLLFNLLYLTYIIDGTINIQIYYPRGIFFFIIIFFYYKSEALVGGPDL